MVDQFAFLISIVRALVEVAGLSLLAQGALALIAGPSRDRNPIFRLFRTVTHPVVAAMRLAAPRFVADRFIPPLAFLLLFWLWLGLAYLKQHV